MNQLESKTWYKELEDRMIHFGSGGISLAEHAEMWCLENGKNIPNRNTKAWQDMYEQWIEFAFADFEKGE